LHGHADNDLLLTIIKIRLEDGVFLIAESCEPSNTIINADGEKNAIKITGNKQTGVIGFTIKGATKNGNASGGISVNGNANVLIKNCVIIENKHGIISNGNNTVCIEATNIVKNTGDALLVHGNGTVRLSNSILANNEGADIDKRGNSGELNLENNRIFDNGTDDYKVGESLSIDANGLAAGFGAGTGDCQVDKTCIELPERTGTPIDIGAEVEPANDNANNGKKHGKAKIHWSGSGRVENVAYYEVFTATGLKIAETTETSYEMLIDANISYFVKIRAVGENGTKSEFSKTILIVFYVDDNDVVNGLEETQANRLVRLYPNPNQGEFKIAIDGDYFIGRLTIYDASGRVTFEKQVNNNQTEVEINQNLTSGIYFIVGKGEKSAFAVRFIVE